MIKDEDIVDFQNQFNSPNAMKKRNKDVSIN